MTEAYEVNITNITTNPWSSPGEKLGSTFVICGLGIVLIQVLFLFATAVLKLEKVKDVAGGLTFVTVALVSLFIDLTKPTRINEIKWKTHQRQILGTALVCSWGIRLAGYLLARHIRMGQKIHPGPNRVTCCRHLAYWTFQAIWVFVVSLPIMCINSSRPSDNRDLWTPIDIVGTTFFGIGLFFELISDQQKFNWKFYRMGNKGLWVTHRLWGWSRHPNYFFEIIVWWGIFILSTNILQGVAWVSVLSPLFVIFIVLCVSGLPVVEATADGKYSKYEDYRHYKRNTSIIIPIHPFVYKYIPNIIRHTVLLDLPVFDYLEKIDDPESIPVSPMHMQHAFNHK